MTLVKGRRHTPEQVVRKLREADRLLAEGSDVDAVCRQLEKENARLKRLLAEKELDNDMLREVARGNW